jgi:CorA-like Mg2+ transporter protein
MSTLPLTSCFLPLTVIAGFFGMNFGWMVGQIDTQLAFWLLGIGTSVAGVLLIQRFVLPGFLVQVDTADAAHRSREMSQARSIANPEKGSPRRSCARAFRSPD